MTESEILKCKMLLISIAKEYNPTSFDEAVKDYKTLCKLLGIN